MAATRNRKQEKDYKAYLQTVDPKICVFCAIHKKSSQYINETKYNKIIKNVFPYSLWELIKVSEHLMITPKRHVGSLDKLNNQEALDYMKIIQTYEKKGYNIYARAPSSPTRSILHQHTHLIKTSGKPKKYVIYSKKPTFRITL